MKGMRHQAREDTVDALLALKKRHVSTWRNVPHLLRFVAKERGVEVDIRDNQYASMNAMCRGVPGAVSPEFEDQIRIALDLQPVNQMRYACPTCGSFHSLTPEGTPIDCHGKTVYVRPVAARKKDTHKPSYRPRLDPKWRKYKPEEIDRILSEHEEAE